MAKLILVSRQKVRASLKKLEKLQKKDPQWLKEKKEMEKWEAKEKKRRDVEFAAKRAGKKGKEVE